MIKLKCVDIESEDSEIMEWGHYCDISAVEDFRELVGWGIAHKEFLRVLLF